MDCWAVVNFGLLDHLITTVQDKKCYATIKTERHIEDHFTGNGKFSMDLYSNKPLWRTKYCIFLLPLRFDLRSNLGLIFKPIVKIVLILKYIELSIALVIHT